MPRRKKKSNLERRPSLVFTDSPIHVQKNLPSPVFCARHPPTAKSVPVEALQHLPWVSSQFQALPSSFEQTRPKITRHRRRSLTGMISARKNNNSVDTATSLTETRVRNKYTSLKFVGDRSTVLSDIEDVSIDGITSIEDDRCNARISELDSSHELCSDNRIASNRSATTKIEKLVNANKIDVLAKICIGNKGSGKEKTGTTVDKTGKDILSEDGIVDRQIRKSHESKKAPMKHLFESHIDVDSNKIDKSLDTESDTGNYDYLTDNEIQKSENEIDTHVHVRKSARISTLHRLLPSDSPSTCRQNIVVLVPDTPELQCGWPLRKRQLMQYVKNNKR